MKITQKQIAVLSYSVWNLNFFGLTFTQSLRHRIALCAVREQMSMRQFDFRGLYLACCVELATLNCDCPARYEDLLCFMELSATALQPLAFIV